MLLVVNIRKEFKKEMSSDEEKLFGIDKLKVIRPNFPAITHVDYSSRLQTVSKETNSRFHQVISKFYEKLPKPVLIAQEEWKNKEIYFRNPNKENEYSEEA